MKKYIFCIVLVLDGVLLWLSQDLNTSQVGPSKIKVQPAMSGNKVIDSTQFKTLRVIITEEKMVSDTIKSNISDLNALESIISPRYEKLKQKQSFNIDSCLSRYHLRTIWKKEKIIKTTSVSYSNNTINIQQKDDSKTLPNFEYLLLIILTIYLLYLELNKKNLALYLEWILLSGMMIILYIAWPNDDIANAFAILFIPLTLVSFLFKAFVYVEIPRYLSIILVLAVFSGYLFKEIDFVFVTTAIGLITSIIIIIRQNKLLRSKTKPETSQ